MRIEIAGSIAVGKTTLSDQLEKSGYHVVRENLAENPYITRNYRSKESRGLDVSLSFLISKSSALEALSGQKKTVVSDYALIAEYAYINRHLPADTYPDSHKLCNDAVDIKRQQIGDPDILIYLTCPARVQMDRIKKRGRDFEKTLTEDYLNALNKDIDNDVRNRLSSSCKVLEIRTDKVDLTDPVAMKSIIAKIESLSGPSSSSPNRDSGPRNNPFQP